MEYNDHILGVLTSLEKMTYIRENDSDTGYSVSSEDEHPHQCFRCGQHWRHASDACDFIDYVGLRYYGEASCPDCDGEA